MTAFKHSSKHAEPFAEAANTIAGNTVAGRISRRSFVEISAACIVASAAGTALPLSALAQTKKSPQKLVKYQPTPKLNRKCADCTFFLADQKACKVVKGVIEPEGWCLRWAKKNG